MSTSLAALANSRLAHKVETRINYETRHSDVGIDPWQLKSTSILPAAAKKDLAQAKQTAKLAGNGLAAAYKFVAKDLFGGKDARVVYAVREADYDGHNRDDIDLFDAAGRSLGHGHLNFKGDAYNWSK